MRRQHGAARTDVDEPARELHRIVRPGGRVSLLEPLDGAAPVEALVAAGFAGVSVEPDEGGAGGSVTARRG